MFGRIAVIGVTAVAMNAAAVAGCAGEEAASAPRLRMDASADVEDAGRDGASEAVSRRICDGSTDIRFAFSYAPGAGAPPHIVSLYHLGVDFLYVDGACRYWVDQPSSIPDEYRLWRPVREGVLTPVQEAALHAAVAYDDFSNAPACTDLSEAQDVDVARIWDGKRVHLCSGSLEAPPDWPLRGELYAAGAAVGGPVRIQLSKVPVDEIELKYAWPLGDSPSMYVVDGDESKSFRIEEAAAAQSLRRLREEAIEEAAQTPGYFRGYIGILPGDDVLEPGEGYALAIRDDLAFTNAEGRWSPPP